MKDQEGKKSELMQMSYFFFDWRERSDVISNIYIKMRGKKEETKKTNHKLKNFIKKYLFVFMLLINRK